jgi:putative transposase
MPRHLRVVLAGTPLHIVQRGHNRAPTFHYPDEYLRYRDLLAESARRYGCAVHAYVLMTNHVHLLLTPERADGPARMMQYVGRQYVPWINRQYRRTGTLWDGRYWSCVVDGSRYLWACARYIERNPLRARMVDVPAQYPWSSYRANAHGEPDPLVVPHALYTELAATAEARQAAYRALFGEDEAPMQLAALRRALHRGTVLGDAGFQDAVDRALGRSTVRRSHGGDRRGPAFRTA